MQTRPFPFAAAIAMPLALAGCFTSEQPLLTVAEADFPFEKFVVADIGDNLTTFERSADGYRIVGGGDLEASLTLLLDDRGDGVYLVQAAGAADDGPDILYGVIAVDLAAETARIYMSVADEAELGEDSGLVFCEPGVVCLTELSAYVDRAKAMIAAGSEPDNEFTIVSTE